MRLLYLPAVAERKKHFLSIFFMIFIITFLNDSISLASELHAKKRGGRSCHEEIAFVVSITLFFLEHRVGIRGHSAR